MVILADGYDLKSATDIRDAVVPCQGGVEDRKIRVDEGLDGEIFLQHMVKKLDGFLLEQIFDSFIKFKVLRIHREATNARQIEPLCGKVLREGL